MDNKATTDLRFIIGVVHGYINRHDSLYPSKTLKVKIIINLYYII